MSHDSAPLPQRGIATCPALPIRPSDGHKGTFGRVLIFGGSTGMSGAVCLTGVAALRAGAGLVTVAIPESILSIVAGFEPSYMTVPLPVSDASEESGRGQVGLMTDEFLNRLIRGKNAIAVGPGLGTGDGVTALTASVIQRAACPVVIDADALNALAAGHLMNTKRERLVQSEQREYLSLILTPHPGEFARLSGESIESIQRDRTSIALEFAASQRVILVLKGPSTIVTDGVRLYVNSTGNAGMATGGSGDVLTGIIASLVGQGMSSFDAACLGVFVHGLAGDLAAEQLTQRGMISSDLLHYLPLAWKLLEQGSQSAGD